jgi:hypothetical protein
VISRTGPSPGTRRLPVLEGDAEPSGQGVLGPGVVPLGGGHRGGVQHPGVQGQPPWPTVGMVVDCPDLVRDRQMGVQVVVAGAGLAVVERSGQEPAGLHLLLAAVTDPRERRLLLQPAQRVRHRLVVGVLHRLPGSCRPERPQQGRGLHRGEHQVVAGHSTTFATSLLRLELRHRTTGDGRCPLSACNAATLPRPAAATACTAGTPGRASRRGPRPPRWRPPPAARSSATMRSASGCSPRPNSAPHLILPGPTRHLQVGGAGTHPPARRVPRGRVVVRQLLGAGAAVVPGRHLPGQVRVAVPVSCNLRATSTGETGVSGGSAYLTVT